MNSFISGFTIYETLRILIPGFYFSSSALKILKVFITDKSLADPNLENTVLYIVCSILSGLFIYSIDVPKRVGFFQQGLPSTAIKRKHPELDKILITNNYFEFYDNLSSEMKLKTELYSGLYHFAINVASVALLISLSNLTIIHSISNYDYIHLFIAFFSIISAINIYHQRLSLAFKRQLNKYYQSEQYKDLITKSNN
jgi:hypothetical protein